MAVENLDQLVDLIITRTPSGDKDAANLRTFVKGEIQDFMAHQPARYCKVVGSLVLHGHFVAFINFIIRKNENDSPTESHKGDK